MVDGGLLLMILEVGIVYYRQPAAASNLLYLVYSFRQFATFYNSTMNFI
jgi:hypothetical protein